jgi:hypothetical protein
MSIFIFPHEEESSHKLNIDDLYERKQRRDLKQISIFNKILGRIHKKINHTAAKKKLDETHTWFIVPEYIVGEPIYDKGECIGYLVAELEKNGFHIKYTHPNTLFISWHNWVPSYVRSEVKKKMGVILDEKGNVIGKKDDSEESNPHMLTDNPLDNMLLKQQNAANYKEREKEQKQYISVKNYKPLGSLVYSSDMFEKLEKKIARDS